MARLGRHLSYANVIATLALFVALGGSSYAALQLTGRDIRNGSLTGADVRNNSLTGKDIKNLRGGDIKNNSLTGRDIKNISSGDIRDGSLRARDFRAGELPAGPAGPAGPQGPAGAKGDPGPATGAAGGALSGSYPAPGLAADLDALIPSVVLNVETDGTLRSSRHRAPLTRAPVVTQPATGVYDIDLPGAAFKGETDVVTCTLGENAASGGIAVNGILDQDLRVFIADGSGTGKDQAFRCAVWLLG